MILQLNPQIPMWVVDKGEGFAIAMIDYSADHHIIWVVAMNSGEIWSVPNHKVRVQWNYSMDRQPGEK